MTEAQHCTCPLIDISSLADGTDRKYVRGNPRGTGCPSHETQQMRDEDQRARDAARYGTHREA